MPYTKFQGSLLFGSEGNFQGFQAYLVEDQLSFFPVIKGLQ